MAAAEASELKRAARAAFEGAKLLDSDLGGVQAWRCAQTGLQRVLPGFCGQFFSGDWYVVLCAVTRGGALARQVFYWLGEGTIAEEQAAAQAVAFELDELLGGSTVVRREVQGHESASFCAALGGQLEYLAGGWRDSSEYADDSSTGELRLLHVRGRRHFRVRHLAKAEASALNEGDVFVLDAGSTLYQWNGRASSKKERACALELCRGLRQRRAEAQGLPVEHLLITQGEAPSEGEARFWRAIGGDASSVGPALPAPDDGEQAPGGTKLWRLAEVYSTSEGRKKLQVTEILDRPLLRTMLDPTCCFILVAPAVLWIWVGSDAALPTHKPMLYAQSFLQGKKRPSWTPVARIVDGAEPSLFSANFSNWHGSPRTRTSTAAEWLVASSAARVLREARLVLPAEAGGVTELRVWRMANERDAVEVPASMHGLFYSSDVYVVRFTYTSRGRSRAALYEWHGRRAGNAEREAAARRVGEMDESLRGIASRTRIAQNVEPEHFLSLFDGRMLVREGGAPDGAVADPRDIDSVALFQVHGSEDACAVRAVQVVAAARSLNSADCFILQRPGGVHVWHGSGSSAEEQATAMSVGQAISSQLALTASAAASAEGGGQSGAAAEVEAVTAAGGGAEVDGDGDAPTSVTLLVDLDASGEMPDGVHVDKLGTFIPLLDEPRVNERMCYAKEANPNLMMWWGGGRWWIGKCDERGQNRGWIKVEGEGEAPPCRGWVVYSSRAKMWKAATEVTCKPAERLEAGGLGAGSPHAEKLGTFVRCYDNINGKPAYSRETRPNLMMWWGGGRWWIGKRDEAGENRGWIKMTSNAPTPEGDGASMDESATSAWLVYWPKEKAWLPADAMAIRRVVPPSSAPKVSGAPPERPKAPPAAKSWPVMQCPEFSEPDEFWSVLGGQQAYPRARADEAPPAFAPRLFCCTDASGSFTVDELLNYSQRDLDHSDVFILDCWSAVFVWVGRNANEDERTRAIETAWSYAAAQVAVDGRAMEVPICVVRGGDEPPTFTCNFAHWSVEEAERHEDSYGKRLRLLREQPQPDSMMAPLQAFDKSSHLPAITPLPKPPELPNLSLAAVMSASGLTLRDAMTDPERLDSTRRRAAAAAAAGHSLVGADFEDPQTSRYSYEHIASDRRDSLNPVCKELYLTESDFSRIFGMDKAQFYSMKLWKQRELKRRVGLF